MSLRNSVIEKLFEIDKGDAKRISHFIKVNAFANQIAENENLTKAQKEVIDIASLTHDIGIKESERLYNSTNGKYQEELGEKLARELLTSLTDNDELINKVAYLVSIHHTYNLVAGIEYQILIEADFLVNAYEDRLKKESIETMKKRIFKTSYGTKLLDMMFDIK